MYFPDQDLADGAAEAASHGYLDFNNAPPWDTWVAFVETQGKSDDSHLVSWVPAEFTALVDAGVWANPEECILWLDDAPIALREAVGQVLRAPRVRS